MEIQETIYSCSHCGEELDGLLPCDCDADTVISIEMTGECLVRITLRCDDELLKIVVLPAEARRIAIMILEEAEKADQLKNRLR